MVNTEPERLQDLFPEFTAYQGLCQFRGCLHRHEPKCAVKQAVAGNSIAHSRYENYLLFLSEIEAKQPY